MLSALVADLKKRVHPKIVNHGSEGLWNLNLDIPLRWH
jgi:hypothetical protein